MQRTPKRVRRVLATTALVLSILGLGTAPPAEGQEYSDEAVGLVEVHQMASGFSGAARCTPSETVYQPNFWGVIVPNGGQAETVLVSQCGDRYGLLVMQAADTDPDPAPPPSSLRVTLTGVLYAGVTPCRVKTVVVDVPDARGIQFFDRTLQLYGCRTSWRLDVQVWYGSASAAAFCPRVMWC